ncbi:hypothetical protein As57867_007836, partial [Aphanomyces stellatus]
MDAAKNDRVSEIRDLLSQGADVNWKDDSGCTPLMNGVYYGKPEVVKELLAQNAAVNQQDLSGKTALMFAADYGYDEILQMLLAAGADPSLKNRNGETARDKAVSSSQKVTVTLIDGFIATGNRSVDRVIGTPVRSSLAPETRSVVGMNVRRVDHAVPPHEARNYQGEESKLGHRATGVPVTTNPILAVDSSVATSTQSVVAKDVVRKVVKADAVETKSVENDDSALVNNDLDDEDGDLKKGKKVTGVSQYRITIGTLASAFGREFVLIAFDFSKCSLCSIPFHVRQNWILRSHDPDTSATCSVLYGTSPRLRFHAAAFFPMPVDAEARESPKNDNHGEETTKLPRVVKNPSTVAERLSSIKATLAQRQLEHARRNAPIEKHIPQTPEKMMEAKLLELRQMQEKELTMNPKKNLPRALPGLPPPEMDALVARTTAFEQYTAEKSQWDAAERAVHDRVATADVMAEDLKAQVIHLNTDGQKL